MLRISNKQVDQFKPLRRDVQVIRKAYKGKELRNFDLSVYNDSVTTNNVSSIAAGSTPYLLNNPGQGTTAEDYAGRRYLLSSVDVRAKLRFDPTQFDPLIATVRLTLIVDTRSNGNNNGYQTLFEAPSNPENSVLSFLDIDEADRFIILEDRLESLQPTANIKADEMSNCQKVVQFYCPLERYGLEVCRSDIASTFPANYSIYLCAISTSTTVKIDFVSRVRFYNY